MPIHADYHTHTALCGHASGEPKEYVRTAVKAGLKEIGFSDHAPLLSHRDPTITMDYAQLPLYHQMIERVQDQFREQITVRVGIEADYIPGFEDQTRALLAQYPYDYVIGSVHMIGQWGFDDPSQCKEWNKKDVNTVYEQYYKLLRESAAAGLFDILGHVDLVKKFNFVPTVDITAEIEENAKAFKKAGVVIEVNSSGLRKPAREIYPSLHNLKIYAKHRVPITFGSDAHEPEDVGRDFDRSRDLALAAGYKEYVIFRGRKIAGVKKL